MLAAVVGQRDLASRDRSTVQGEARDAPHDAMGILDDQSVAGRVIAKEDLESRPCPRNARVHVQCLAAQAKPEDGFHSRAIHPAGRSGVPGPTAAARVRPLRVDVAGHHVRLDLVPVEARARARVVDRIQDREELAGLVSVAQGREGDDRPNGGVRVLSAVLAHSRDVSLM